MLTACLFVRSCTRRLRCLGQPLHQLKAQRGQVSSGIASDLPHVLSSYGREEVVVRQRRIVPEAFPIRIILICDTLKGGGGRIAGEVQRFYTSSPLKVPNSVT